VSLPHAKHLFLQTKSLNSDPNKASGSSLKFRISSSKSGVITDKTLQNLKTWEPSTEVMCLPYTQHKWWERDRSTIIEAHIKKAGGGEAHDIHRLLIILKSSSAHVTNCWGKKCILIRDQLYYLGVVFFDSQLSGFQVLSSFFSIKNGLCSL